MPKSPTVPNPTVPNLGCRPAPKLREQINALFDGLVRASATAETIAQALDIPLENAARELDLAERRLRPTVPGCRPMVQFPDDDAAWGNVHGHPRPFRS